MELLVLLRWVKVQLRISSSDFCFILYLCSQFMSMRLDSEHIIRSLRCMSVVCLANVCVKRIHVDYDVVQ